MLLATLHCSMNSTLISCRTITWYRQHRVNPVGHCLEREKVEVTIDGSIMHSSEDFCIMHDPVVKSMTPMKSVIR